MQLTGGLVFRIVRWDLVSDTIVVRISYTNIIRYGGWQVDGDAPPVRVSVMGSFTIEHFSQC
jgi:hypothetical protein